MLFIKRPLLRGASLRGDFCCKRYWRLAAFDIFSRTKRASHRQDVGKFTGYFWAHENLAAYTALFKYC